MSLDQLDVAVFLNEVPRDDVEASEDPSALGAGVFSSQTAKVVDACVVGRLQNCSALYFTRLSVSAVLSFRFFHDLCAREVCREAGGLTAGEGGLATVL